MRREEKSALASKKRREGKSYEEINFEIFTLEESQRLLKNFDKKIKRLEKEIEKKEVENNKLRNKLLQSNLKQQAFPRDTTGLGKEIRNLKKEIIAILSSIKKSRSWENISEIVRLRIERTLKELRK